MRNSILINLTQVWQAKPQKLTFANAINEFITAFGGVCEVDNLLPSLAGKMFNNFLMQYDSENLQTESKTESKKAPLKQIEPQNEKQNEISFVCECGQKFSTVQAKNGHKKGCKI